MTEWQNRSRGFCFYKDRKVFSQGKFKRGLGSTFSLGFREQRGLRPIDEPDEELITFIRNCRSLTFQFTCILVSSGSSIARGGAVSMSSAPCRAHFQRSGFPLVCVFMAKCKELLLVSAHIKFPKFQLRRSAFLQRIIFFYSWSQYNVTEGRFPLCGHLRHIETPPSCC